MQMIYANLSLGEKCVNKLDNLTHVAHYKVESLLGHSNMIKETYKMDLDHAFINTL